MSIITALTQGTICCHSYPPENLSRLCGIPVLCACFLLCKVYWIYWAASFATVITWMFAVGAAADDAWLELEGYAFLELGVSCRSYTSKICELCECR